MLWVAVMFPGVGMVGIALMAWVEDRLTAHVTRGPAHPSTVAPDPAPPAVAGLPPQLAAGT